jgi:spermidine synthase
VYETNIDVFASVVKALSRHFPHYTLYDLDDTNILIVAINGETTEGLNDGAFASAAARAELERIGVRSVGELQRRRLGDERTLGVALSSMLAPMNSDFFPYVDLNGARLRYLRADAVDLPRLTLLPLPFLELLRVSPPQESTVPPSPQSALAYDKAVTRALMVRHAFTGGNRSLPDPHTAAMLALIDMSADRCAEAEGQDEWLSAIQKISDMTIAYLRPGELDALWRRVDASACYRTATDQNKRWIALWQALSRRDPTEIARYGAELLDSQEPLSSDDNAYVTTAVGVSYVRMGRLDDARELLSKQMVRMERPGQFALPLRELLVLSRPSVAAGHAVVHALP